MRTSLVVESAAALAWAALKAPVAAAGVVVDPGTETLVAPPAAFRELIEPGSRLETRVALAAGGAVHGGRLPVLLRAGVEAVRSPARRLTLSAAGAVADLDAWLAGPAAALSTVEPDGRVRLVPLPARAVAAVLVRAMGLDNEPAGAAGGGVRRMAPGALAALLGAGGDAQLERVHAHARLVGPAGEAVEAIGAADGWRSVVVEGDEVVLSPVAADELRDAVARLVGPPAQHA